jgi:hypothetical protein
MKQNLRTEIFFISILIAVNLTIGIATLADYGESWDEARLYMYGDQSINAYQALFNKDIHVDFGDDDLRYYGPAYFMGMSLLVRGVHSFFPQIPESDLWHIGNFICLQFGLVCFYFLARRYINVGPALVTTALFGTQPLIWGHGFINPKDIPFMVFFTASIFFGLRMLDDFERQNFEFKPLFTNPQFYIATLLLGITISIRILGFSAAVIVLFYFAFININKVLRLSYAYYGSALIVSFLTWPFLWFSPISNFIKSIYAMLKFQWIGHTLFNGSYYPSNQLPQAYVPQLLVMQLTELTPLLFAIGITLFLLPDLRKKYKVPIILFLVWFVAPILYILVNGMNLYDNTRQLLFIFPGAFLMIAVGLDFIFAQIKPWWTKSLLVGVIVLPGLIGIARFHPYEYTYYNYFTTSRQQIFRNFETDYWATSFKQISSFLNDHAPENALVIVWGPSQLIERYAREDIQVKSFDELDGIDYSAHPYYLVLTTRYDMDLKIFPEIAPFYSVEHNGATLSVLKYIAPTR